MNKKIIIFLLLLFFSISFVYADKLFFTEFGLGYASIISPGNIENNTTGTKDTMAIDAKAGINILKWVDIYAAGSFYFFMFNQDWQSHYSFYPIAGGVRINILSENLIYPDLFFEYGVAISNLHTIFTDSPWTAQYYNFGISVNLNITDISNISLKIERPTISGKDETQPEIHIIKTSLAWKFYY
jgi:hypothetical protein